MASPDQPRPGQRIVPFSFFDDSGVSRIAVATPADLASYIGKQSAMRPGFLFELWNTQREDDITQVAQIAPNAVEDFPGNAEIIGARQLLRKIPIPQQPEAVCRRFLTETGGLILNGVALVAGETQALRRKRASLDTKVSATIYKAKRRY